MPSEAIYFIEIVWNDGAPTRHLVEQQQIDADTFEAWAVEFRSRAATRPFWAQLGDITFYTQNVRSIELIETIEKED